MRTSRIYPESLPETSSKSKKSQGTKTKLPLNGDPIFANPEVFMTAVHPLNFTSDNKTYLNLIKGVS